MDSNSRLHSQVAAMAGVAADRAMAACYLSDLSKAGRTLNDAANLMRTNRGGVRTIARDWGITFTDYAASDPLVMSWRKDRPGRYVLEQGGEIVAEAVRTVVNGTASYQAKSDPDGFLEDGSSPEIACRRLSLAMEADSLRLFGVDDVEIRFTEGDTLAPKPEPMAPVMRRALSA